MFKRCCCQGDRSPATVGRHNQIKAERQSGIVRERSSRQQTRPGAVSILAAACLVTVVIFAAFAIDIGYICLQQAHLQAAVDAAGHGGMISFPEGEGAVLNAAEALLVKNGYDPSNNESLQVTFEFGDWDVDARQFTPVSFADANCLRVHLVDQTVLSFFGVLMGRDKYSVGAEAIAILSGPPRDVSVVIDCSGSMSAVMSNGQTRNQNSRAAAINFVHSLDDNDRIGLAVFGWEDLTRNDYQKTAIVENWLQFTKGPVLSRIQQLNAGEYGSNQRTNIGAGLRAGLDVLLDSTEQRPPYQDLNEVEQIVVLLTDGLANAAEPYPVPDDGPTGRLPLSPYTESYDEQESITRWSNTIKARGFKLYVITVGDSADSPIMVSAASPPDDVEDSYYYHIAEGPDDSLQLFNIYREISNNGRIPRLVQ